MKGRLHGPGWLEEQNPWWQDPAAIDSDPHIAAWNSAPYAYRPRLMDTMVYDYEPGRQVIYTVRGARQVGKTTMAKLLIRDFLRRGVEPMRTCYCPVTSEFSRTRLARELLGYLELSEPARAGQRAYVFLDEISLVRRWQATLLDLSNMNKLQNCTIVATGSNAADLRRAAETLPGRMGLVPDGSHKVLLPMSFSEYACIKSPLVAKMTAPGEIFDPARRGQAFVELASGNNMDHFEQMCSHTSTLDDLLSRYMITGGFARVVNATAKRQTIGDSLYLEHINSLMEEWSIMGHDLESLLRYLKFTLKSMGDTVSWHGLAQEAGLRSSHYASEYAYALRDMYVLSVTYAYDASKKLPDSKKAKKLHVRDPMLFHAINGRMSHLSSYDGALQYLRQDENKGRMAESIAADHLVRMAYEFSPKKAMFDPSFHLLYWKDRRNREVDFVYRHPVLDEVPIEIKYRSRISHRKLGGLTAFLEAAGAGRGIVASRYDHEAKKDYTVVPLSVLLMLA